MFRFHRTISKDAPSLQATIFMLAAAGVAILLGQIAVTLAGRIVILPNGRVVLLSQGTTYYLSQAGDDTKDGKTQATAWKTMGKLNTFIAGGGLHPGDTVLMRRGDVWRDDYLKVQNQTVATSGTDIPAIYPLSGTTGAPITVNAYGSGANPLIDGGDTLNCTWTNLSGNVWQCANVTSGFTSITIDHVTSNSLALTQAANARGAYSSSTTYNYLDGVTSSAGYSVCGLLAGCTGIDPTLSSAYLSWANLTNANSGNSSYTFPTTNSGLQNVAAIGSNSWQVYVKGGSGYASSTTFTATCNGSPDTLAGTMLSTSGVPNVGPLQITAKSSCPNQPVIVLTSPAVGASGVTFVYTQDRGSWYWDGSTITLQLQDGSNPNSHSIELTRRPYGILLQSANHWTVQNVDVGHTSNSGILSMAYSDPFWGYWTNEYNQFFGVNSWNCSGSILVDSVGDQSGSYKIKENSNITVMAYQGRSNPHLIRGLYIAPGTLAGGDGYFGQRGGGANFSMYLAGIDAEPSVLLPYGRVIVQGGTFTNINGTGVFYTSASQGGSTGLSNGGQLVNMTITGTEFALGFGGVGNGRVHNNSIHDNFGEGIQLGGSSTGVRIDHNVIANQAKGPSGTGYNGIDCNGMPSPASGPNYVNEIDHNTIYNTNSAIITFESPGCQNANVHDNAFDQYALSYQPGDPSRQAVLSPSSLTYTTTYQPCYLTTPLTSGSLLNTLGCTALSNELIGNFTLSGGGNAQTFVTTGAALGDVTVATSTVPSYSFPVTTVSQGGTVIGYLAANLSTSGSITSFATSALTVAPVAGTLVLTSGANSQSFTASAGSIGDTSIAIASATPSYAFSYTVATFDAFSNSTFSHNFWVPGSNTSHPFKNPGPACITGLGFSTDTCLTGISTNAVNAAGSALGFGGEAGEDFSLAAGSPLIGAGLIGDDVGAIPAGCTNPLQNCNN